MEIKDYYVGQRVKWLDPGINDYEPEDREMVLNRVFIIGSVDNESGEAFIYEEDGPSEAEVYTTELLAI